ncbi:hypothetical protein D5018_20470 [Parashewanella curva]|uniref:Uncharacterized protein n=1 Tax=Parashewanella curva TaxID=2338552 RepID=A0A3L8PR23_9GAMM|nr:hypothetical protein [Parashewanella curva]RLV57830.1 hypothetical protein D5018_20470 [Parashewanella curva]
MGLSSALQLANGIQQATKLAEKAYNHTPSAETLAQAGLSVGIGLATAGPLGGIVGLGYSCAKHHVDNAVDKIVDAFHGALPTECKGANVAKYTSQGLKLGLHGVVTGSLAPQGVVYGTVKSMSGIVGGQLTVNGVNALQDRAGVAKDSYGRRFLNFITASTAGYLSSQAAGCAMDAVTEYVYPTEPMQLDGVGVENSLHVDDDIDTFEDARDTFDNPELNQLHLKEQLLKQSGNKVQTMRHILSIDPTNETDSQPETHHINQRSTLPQCAQLVANGKGREWYVPFPDNSSDRKTTNDIFNVPLDYSNLSTAINNAKCTPVVRYFDNNNATTGLTLKFSGLHITPPIFSNCSENGEATLSVYISGLNYSGEILNPFNTSNQCEPPDKVAYGCSPENYTTPMVKGAEAINSTVVRDVIVGNNQINVGLNISDDTLINDTQSGKLIPWKNIRRQIANAKVTNYCYGNKILNIEFLNETIWEELLNATQVQQEACEQLAETYNTSVVPLENLIQTLSTGGVKLPPNTFIQNGNHRIPWVNLTAELEKLEAIGECKTQGGWLSVPIETIETAFGNAVKSIQSDCSSSIELLPFNSSGYTIDQIVQQFQAVTPEFGSIGLSIAPNQPIIVNGYPYSWRNISGFINRQLCIAYPNASDETTPAFKLIEKQDIIDALNQFSACVNFTAFEHTGQTIELASLLAAADNQSVLELPLNAVVSQGDSYTSWALLRQQLRENDTSGACIESQRRLSGLSRTKITAAFEAAPKASFSDTSTCINSTFYQYAYQARPLKWAELNATLEEDAYAYQYGIAIDPEQIVERDGRLYLWSDIESFLNADKVCLSVDTSNSSGKMLFSPKVYRNLSPLEVEQAIDEVHQLAAASFCDIPTAIPYSETPLSAEAVANLTQGLSRPNRSEAFVINPEQKIQSQDVTLTWQEIYPFLLETHKCSIDDELAAKSLTTEDINLAIAKVPLTSEPATEISTPSSSINVGAIVGGTVAGTALLIAVVVPVTIIGLVVFDIKVNDGKTIERIRDRMNVLLRRAGKQVMSNTQVVEFIVENKEQTEQVFLGELQETAPPETAIEIETSMPQRLPPPSLEAKKDKQ